MTGASFIVDRLRVEGLPRSPLSFRASAGEVIALCGPTGEVDDALRLTGAPRDPDADADQRTRVAMALAFLEQPAAIVIDDVDRGVTAPEERGLWRAFHDVAAQGPTVLGTTSDPDAAAAGGARVVSLC